MMNRKRALYVSATLLLLIGLLVGARAQMGAWLNGPRRPNVVVVLADDAGYADFGMQGSSDFHTPRIDRLASQGVRFTQGYVTAPVCSPSRAALLSGRYQQRFGHEANPAINGGPKSGLPVEVETLGDMLRAEGYATGAVGKWHLGTAPHFHPTRRGFDHFFGFLVGERSYLPGRVRRGQELQRNGEPEQATGYLTDVLGEEAAHWINANADEPFFLYVAFSAVHMPLEATRADLDAQDSRLKGKRRTLGAMTTALDRAVGTVLDALDANELADDTLVFFINDNGAGRNGGNNSPLRGGKGGIYEGGIRVPWVIRWPGVVSAGSTFDQPVSTLDVVPTALMAAGRAHHAGLDGVDLRPHLDGTVASPPHDTLLWRMGSSWAVRDGSWKLLSQKGGPLELYDLATDPGEAYDRAAVDPERVAAMQGLWTTWNNGLIGPVFPSATRVRRGHLIDSEDD